MMGRKERAFRPLPPLTLEDLVPGITSIATCFNTLANDRNHPPRVSA